MHQIMALVAFFLTEVVYCRPALKESDESVDTTEHPLGYGTKALRTVTIVVGVALLITLICVFSCIWSVFHDIKQRQHASLKLSSNQSVISGVGQTIAEPVNPKPKETIKKIKNDKPLKVSPNVETQLPNQTSNIGVTNTNTPIVDYRGNQAGQSTQQPFADDTQSVASVFSVYRPT